ncbi:MAG: FAD-binding oxidoreductase [Candidatus Wildermuthbacteria bacterium]|nr:FAD-binding oxidoreductase [Candidatus Wildermuthbacteria bacterium]
MNIKEELQRVVRGEVVDDENTLKKYSTDASIFEVRPRLVVFPKGKEDIKAIIHFIDVHPKEKLSVTCRSAGSDMSGGPLNEGIIIDVSRYMNQLKEIEGHAAVVEPGLLYRVFEKEAGRHHLLFPTYPASKDMCAFGGILANNSGGEKSLVYGKTENYVEELKVILRDGNEYVFRPLTKKELSAKLRKKGLEGEIYSKIYKLINENWDLLQKAKPNVSKNSAGYFLWNVWDKEKEIFDLTKLLVGSQGTLGIITEAKVRLVDAKRHSVLLVIFLKNLSPLADIVGRVLKSKPESFESYDDHTLKLVLRFLLEFVSLLGAKNILALLWQFLPELRMLISGGLPKLVLLAEFTADSLKNAKEMARAAQQNIADFHIQTRIAAKPLDVQKYLTIRRQSFNLLRHHVKNKKSSPFIDDIIVRPELLPKFLPELNVILAKYPDLIYTVAGHAGDGNFHIIPLMDLTDAKVRNSIPSLSKKVYDLVMRYRGSITAEHNDGLIRTPFLKQMYGKEVCNLFRKTKEIFDPKGIFNPRKKVGTSLQYAISHIMHHN